MNFTYIKDKQDYIQFIDSVKDEFGCVEDWEYFFGFNLKWDEETGETLETIFEYQGEIEYCPNSFPAIVYSWFDSGEDRCGNFGIRIVDFATFEELRINT